MSSQALVFEHLVSLFEEIVELLGGRVFLKYWGTRQVGFKGYG